MRLLAQENPAALSRYRHVKPARRWGTTPCGARCEGTRHTCSQARGHSGPHVAHGLLRRVVAVWDGGPEARAVEQASRRVREARKRRRERGRRSASPAKGRPVGMRSGDAPGPLTMVWRGIVHTVTHVEELAFVLMFIVFVYFGIDWLRLIFGG